MEKLQETEFAQLNATCEARRCNHNIVKLYDKGTHSDYGCVNCKMQSMNLEDFERIRRKLSSADPFRIHIFSEYDSWQKTGSYQRLPL